MTGKSDKYGVMYGCCKCSGCCNPAPVIKAPIDLNDQSICIKVSRPLRMSHIGDIFNASLHNLYDLRPFRRKTDCKLRDRLYNKITIFIRTITVKRPIQQLYFKTILHYSNPARNKTSKKILLVTSLSISLRDLLKFS